MENSPLSRLSPELRNLIYEHTFTSPYAVTLSSSTSPTNNQDALTRTCRKIRQESRAMYYSLTRFNAHLDDGPATPLSSWLKVLGPKLVLCIEHINIWVRTGTARDPDMHMLNGTLHGQDSTARLLSQPPEEGHRYILRPIRGWKGQRGWYIRDIILALQSIHLGLMRFCIVPEGVTEEDQNDARNLKLTSEFAIVRSG